MGPFTNRTHCLRLLSVALATIAAMVSGCVHLGEYPPGMKQLWAFHEGESMSMPVLAAGRIFVFGGRNAYAIDPTTGRELWRMKGKAGEMVGAAAHGDTVYFVDFGGFVYAVDARALRLKWSRLTVRLYPGPGSPGLAVLGDGICVGGVNKLACLDSTNGRPRWIIRTPDLHYFTDLEATDGILCYQYDWDAVVASARDGSTRWKLPGGGFAVQEGVMYSDDSEGTLRALDLRTGHRLWKIGKLGGPNGVHVSGKIAVLTGWNDESRELTVKAVDLKARHRIWTSIVRIADEHLWNSDRLGFRLEGDAVYISAGYDVSALDIHSGKPLWRFRARGRVASSPAIADGVLYCATSGGLYALKLAR